MAFEGGVVLNSDDVVCLELDLEDNDADVVVDDFVVDDVVVDDVVVDDDEVEAILLDSVLLPFICSSPKSMTRFTGYPQTILSVAMSVPISSG